METELKLRFLDPRGRDILLADEWFQSLVLPETPEETHMVAVYYDTADGRLHAKHAAYRIRLEGDDYIASIKARGKVSGGLHQRLEWNLSQEDDNPDLPVFATADLLDGDSEGVLKELLDAVGDEDLVEVCRTEFDRLAMMVACQDTLIEAAFDFGTLSAADRSIPMEEMELELKEGDVRDLIELGRELVRRFPVVPEEMSKYARCMDMKKKPQG